MRHVFHLLSSPLLGFSILNGKFECPSVEDSFVVNVKEIGVKGGLQDAGEDRDGLGGFVEAPAINPVQEVEGAVQAQAEEVMRGDGFGFSGFLELKHLREDGNGFQ